MKKFDLSPYLPHSLGHTSTGKLILDQVDPERLHPTFIRWTARDHQEALLILEEKLRKGTFSKELFLCSSNGYQVSYRKSDLENHVRFIADLHQEMYNLKSRKS